MTFFRLLLLGSLMVFGLQALGNLDDFSCQNRRLLLPPVCQKVEGLQDYLNSPSQDPLLIPSLSNQALIKHCLMQVRRKNVELIKDSKPQCRLADDKAFQLLMALGRQDMEKRDGQIAHQKDYMFSVTHPRLQTRCFGPICYGKLPHRRSSTSRGTR